MAYSSRKHAREMHDASGSGEPLPEYNSDVIDKADNGDLHKTCRENGQNRLAHEIAKATPCGQSPMGTPSTGHPNIHLNNNKEQCHRM